MKKSKHTVTPKLRFPEFRDKGEWNTQRLGSVTTIIKGKGVSKAELAPDGKQPCIRYGELYTHYGEVIKDVVARTNVNTDDLVLSRKQDVIIPSSGETKIDIATASCVMLDNVALGSDLNILRSRLYGPFFSYYLNGAKRFDIAKVAQGDTVAHLYPNQLEKVDISYPFFAEQQKIAGCLSSLDDLIAAEGRMLEALKAHKKGLMQQLFPQPGETTPRLRFPEFRDTGEWEEKVLSDTCMMQAGKFVAASNIIEQDEDGLYPCFGGNGLRGFTKSRTHDGIYPLIGRQGALCGNVRLARGEFHATEHAVVATPSKGVDVIWLFYVLDWLNLNRFATGQAQPGLSVDVLEQVTLAVPTSEEEQRRIADCLSSLDARIAGQAAKIESLRQHKRGLMQQLFPALEES